MLNSIRTFTPGFWVRVRFRVEVKVGVPGGGGGRVYDRIYVTGGKCPRTVLNKYPFLKNS